MFDKQGPALEPIIRGLGTKSWSRAYAQGYKVGYQNLPVATHRSKIYRVPRIAAIPWDTAYARGTADRIRKETGLREEEFTGQFLLKEIKASNDIVFKEDSNE